MHVFCGPCWRWGEELGARLLVQRRLSRAAALDRFVRYGRQGRRPGSRSIELRFVPAVARKVATTWPVRAGEPLLFALVAHRVPRRFAHLPCCPGRLSRGGSASGRDRLLQPPGQSVPLLGRNDLASRDQPRERRNRAEWRCSRCNSPASCRSRRVVRSARVSSAMRAPLKA